MFLEAPEEYFDLRAKSSSEPARQVFEGDDEANDQVYFLCREEEGLIGHGWYVTFMMKKSGSSH